MIVEILVALFVAYYGYYLLGKLYRFYQLHKRINKIPGPSYKIPLFGLAFELTTIKKEHRLEWLKNIADQYEGGMIRTWLGPVPSVHVRKPEHLEVILRSHTEITKSPVYTYMMPWLGSGLLTSTGGQWHHSRKLITPAFHFSILEEFAEVMLDKIAILIDCIDREIKIRGEKPIEFFDLAVRAALDIICETAMGVNVHAQEQSDESEYIKSVHTIASSVTYRLFRPWLISDFVFNRTDVGQKFNEAVKTTHDICTAVIKRKQRERELGEHKQVDPLTGKTKRKAFMDILLEENEKEENPLSIREIIDNTNTFMFAGHDTTGALVSWTVYVLGNELDIQRQVHEELDEVLGDADGQTLLKQLPNLKYLDRVIKEVLRLYPSATGVSRTLQNDLQIGNYLIPKDTTINIQIYQAHRDPKTWPDPLRFDPDRFLPENIRGRHPYAYIPFSAGPRNCIGQKYAILEAKLTLAQVLRNFNVKSVETPDTIKKYSDIIHRPLEGIWVHMKRRSIGDKI